MDPNKTLADLIVLLKYNGEDEAIGLIAEFAAWMDCRGFAPDWKTIERQADEARAALDDEVCTCHLHN